MQTIEQAKVTLGDEFSSFFDLIHSQLQRLDLDPNARILDVGTGRGAAAVTLALCGYRVLTGEPADDRSKYAKQAWRERAEQVGAEDAITFEPFDAEKVPFADRSFDGVFMLGALHHMRDPAAAVAQCTRVLALGGAICILEPNAAMLELIRAERGLAYVEKAFRDYLLCGIWGAGLVKYGCPHGLSVTAHVRQRPLVR